MSQNLLSVENKQFYRMFKFAHFVNSEINIVFLKETSTIFITLKKFERMFEWNLCENVCLLGGRSFLQLRGGR